MTFQLIDIDRGSQSFEFLIIIGYELNLIFIIKCLKKEERAIMVQFVKPVSMNQESTSLFQLRPVSFHVWDFEPYVYFISMLIKRKISGNVLLTETPCMF